MHRPGRKQDGVDAGGSAQGDATVPTLEPGQLARVFAAPAWLRDLGRMAWLLVGILLLLAGVIGLLSLMETIVVPVIIAAIIAAVLSPLVSWLARHGLGRAGGAAVVLLGVIASGLLIVVLLISGVTSQAPELQKTLQSAVDKVESWLTDTGVSTSGAQSAAEDASASVSDAFHALLEGVGAGIAALAGLAAFLAFTALSLFFLLKDGPLIRDWTERHMGVPHSLGHTITDRTAQGCAATSSASPRWPSSTRSSSAWAPWLSAFPRSGRSC
jgi:putative heme transporter